MPWIWLLRGFSYCDPINYILGAAVWKAWIFKYSKFEHDVKDVGFRLVKERPCELAAYMKSW